MSAKQSCDMISSTANNISSLGDFFKSLNPFASSNNIRNEVRNNLSVDLSEKDVLDIKNHCTNSSNIEQINKLSTSPECINMATTVCSVGNDPEKRATCVKTFLSNENITQANKSKLEQNCMIDSLIDKISKKDASVNNLSAIMALQDAKGLMTSNKVNNAVCNNLDANLSNELFLNAYNSCINETTLKQQNLIDSCGNRDISQSNFYNSIADCLVKNKVIKNSELIGKVVDEMDIKNKQKSEFNLFDTTNIVIGLVVIVCLCITSSLLMFLLPMFSK